MHEGDYLISLNGSDLTLNDNPYRLLENTADKRIELTVNARPVREGARDVLDQAGQERAGSLALDWVESRRQLVDKLSGGRIGYVYVPDTADDGHREFYKGIIAQTDKEAWIIDDRYNGGGYDPGQDGRHAVAPDHQLLALPRGETAARPGVRPRGAQGHAHQPLLLLGRRQLPLPVPASGSWASSSARAPGAAWSATPGARRSWTARRSPCR